MAKARSGQAALREVIDGLRACVEPWRARLHEQPGLDADEIRSAWDDLCARTEKASQALAAVDGQWRGVSRDARRAVALIQAACDGWLSAIRHLAPAAADPKLEAELQGFK